MNLQHCCWIRNPLKNKTKQIFHILRSIATQMFFVETDTNIVFSNQSVETCPSGNSVQHIFYDVMTA